MAQPRIIKRYANRKLYDTSKKCYVTLDHLAELVRTGEEIKVVDNTNGRDLTSITLSQILLEQEKRRASGLPKSFLTELVKSSSSLFENVKRTVSTWMHASPFSTDTVDKYVDELVRIGQLSMDEGKRLKAELAERTRHVMSQLDNQIEHRVTELLQHLGLPKRDDLTQLQERLEALNNRLDALAAPPHDKP